MIVMSFKGVEVFREGNLHGAFRTICNVIEFCLPVPQVYKIVYFAFDQLLSIETTKTKCSLNFAINQIKYIGNVHISQAHS